MTTVEAFPVTRLYQNHGNAIGYWEGWVEFDGNVFVRYAKTLDGKPVEKVYQAEGKNIGKANETTPYEQGVLELASKARLKQDKGYVTDLADAQQPSTNTLGLERPMLATPLEKIKPEAIDWSEAYIQPKLDGHRALFKDGVLYSRQGKELDLPHIVDAINATDLKDMHLDGELYIHGKTLQEMSALIKKHRPESLDIEYHIYDLAEAGHFWQRINRIFNAIPHWPSVSRLKPVPTRKVENMGDVMSAHSSNRNDGYEGTMLRYGREDYRHGKRSRTLLKIKEFHDDEFKIVAVEEGKPYFKENQTWRVPVWVCEASNGKTFTVTAQGNMVEKDALWRNRHHYMGRPLTVKYHYLSAAGIPQLPIALRFHETI